MSLHFVIPAPLQELTGNRREIRADGRAESSTSSSTARASDTRAAWALPCAMEQRFSSCRR